MSEVFGFDEAAQDMEDFVVKADRGKKVMQESADRMRDSARRHFQSQTTTRTGQGASGIQSEHQGDASEVGWSARPGLHGYFHEIGTYKDYPKPHMRPAFDENEQEFLTRVQQAITE